MSFINSYDEIKAQIEERIDNIDGLSATDAALVAAAAQLLNGRNQSIANMQALLTYLQNRQDGVDDDTTIKDIVLLLGASMGSKNVVWRMREFLVNGTFTVPNNIAGGVVYVTGSGGGASGSAIVDVPTTIANAESGNAGCYIYRQPVSVNAGAVVSVVVGAGGASVSASSATSAFAAARAGQASVFGTLTIPGGDANPLAGGGWRSGYLSTPIVLAENSIAYKAGLRVQSGNARAFGSAAGAYGNGCNGAAASGSSVTAASGAANSGAAGGSASVINNTAGSLTATSGAGGSGRIIVEWQEFV